MALPAVQEELSQAEQHFRKFLPAMKESSAMLEEHDQSTNADTNSEGESATSTDGEEAKPLQKSSKTACADSKQKAKAKARSYDTQMSNVGNAGANKSITRKFLGTLSKKLPEPNQQTRILDAGCGTGLLGQHIHQWVVQLESKGDLQLTGVDTNSEMLDLAKSKNCYDELVVADLTKSLPFAGGSFDFVLSSGVFAQGLCGAECLPTMLEPLAPGGYAIFTVSEDLYKQSARTFWAAIESAGCELVEAELMPYYGSRKANVLIVQRAC